MAAIKDLSAIREKWGRVTPQRVPDYEAGVRNPRKDWATSTGQAEDRWKTAIAEASRQGRFGKGVSKAGTPGWQEKTISKGVNRWPEGVQIGVDDYERGFSPYRDEIERTKLPPRFAAGDPRNIQRVAKLADALHKKKIGV